MMHPSSFDWRGSIPSFVRCILLSYGGRQLVLGLPLWMIYGLSRGRMGFGDVTLAFSLGLFL